MTNEAYPTGPAPSPGRIEEKTKAGAWVAYVGAFVLFAVLTNTTTDLSFLPDWLETLVYPLIPALAGLVGAYLKNHKPGRMSRSAIAAVNRT